MITYGDQFRRPGEPPLVTLGGFLRRHLAGVLSGVHILPFFPYSSDDGFSVIDFHAVNPEWGAWADVQAIGRDLRLMVDLVLNHVSARSDWFQAFLRDQAPFREYFTVVPEGLDLSAVFRPRTQPLLTPVRTPSGDKLVWTTFSPDQVDLDYRNPDVLVEMIRVLLLYVERGAQVIRLDAVAYLWKEIGTSCIHLPQTHRVIRLFRAVLDAVAPWVLIVTETNVPHRDNISYFGDGTDEAQMVYQFPLPPLVLDAFRRADAGPLSRWAADLGEPEGNITFFNFLASHDGIGVTPARGILSEDQLQGLAAMVESRGGLVSYRASASGRIPYELNVTYFDGIVEPEEPPELQVRKFMCSQAIMLAFRGVPGIYIHSLLGTRNDREGVERTGANRAINRRKFQLDEIEGALADPGSIQGEVFRRYCGLLRIRRSHPAFHPLAPQQVIDAPPAVLAFVRRAVPTGRQGRAVLCVFNTSVQAAALRAAAEDLETEPGTPARDLVLEPAAGGVGGGAARGAVAASSGPPSERWGGRLTWRGRHLEVPLAGYEFRWLSF